LAVFSKQNVNKYQIVNQYMNFYGPVALHFQTWCLIPDDAGAFVDLNLYRFP